MLLLNPNCENMLWCATSGQGLYNILCKKKLCHKWIPWNFFMAHRLWFPDCIFNDCGNVLSRSKLHFEFCSMRFSISRTFYWIKLPTKNCIFVPSKAYDSWADQTTITQALLVCFILFHFHAFTNFHSKVGSFIIVVHSVCCWLFFFFIIIVLL